jgi:hypothetical protein
MRSSNKYPQLKEWLSPSERLLARAEIAHLPKILWKDEVPDFAAQAIYSGGICLLVPTNLRLLLIDQKFFDLKVDGFSYIRIDTVESDQGLAFGWVNIMLPGRTIELRYLRWKSVSTVCNIINEHVARHHGAVSLPTQQVIATVEQEVSMESVLNQLERLTLLRQSGSITELEFFEQKERILKTQPHVLDQPRRRSPYELGVGRVFNPDPRED